MTIHRVQGHGSSPWKHFVDVPAGPGGGTFREQDITTENIGGDANLADTLNFLPIAPESVILRLNGIVQNFGSDYTLIGTTIRWLAGTGTAVPMSTSDSIEVNYVSA